MPLWAEELECREKPEHIFYFLFFPLLTFSPGWEVDSFWTLRSKQAEAQGSVQLCCEIRQ